MIDAIIDVSDAQGRIDWRQVASVGICLAFIKATEGSRFKAKTFDYNSKAALDAGVAVCAYDFLRPGYATDEASFFIETAGLKKNSLAMLDWEGRAADTCSAQEAESIGASLTEITGREPVGYWGLDGSTPAAPTNKMAGWVRFIPRYPKRGVTCVNELPTSICNNPSRWWPGAMFAQYTCWGRVAGIEGCVDRSIWFGTKDELLTWIDNGTRPSWARQPSVRYTGKLRIGSLGPSVRQLQQRLTDLGFNPGKVDALYGKKTQDAVNQFAAMKNLPPCANGLNVAIWIALFINDAKTPT